MGYIDLHCDTLTEMGMNETLAANGKSVTLHGLKQANVLVQCCSMFIPTGTFEPEEREERIDQEVKRIYGTYRNTLADYSDDLMAIYTYRDLQACEAEEKTGILLTIEDGGVLKGQIDELHKMYDKGVRLITLTWNHENEIGYPNAEDPEQMRLGLKPCGMEIIEEMGRIGVITDVSHLSDGGFYDVANYYQKIGKPFVASHSNARAIADHPRNLTDQMIRKLAECGGVMGLNFYPPFLNNQMSKNGESRICDMIRHLEHIKNVGGVECLALGSDFDGISGQLEITGPQYMWKLWEQMKQHGFTERQLDMIMYENASRVFKDII